MTLGASRLFDRLLGRGAAGVTVPVMDGPLRPNQLLEKAPVVVRAEQADNLTAGGDGVYLSSGNALLRIVWRQGAAELVNVAAMASQITCLAHDGQSALAVGQDEGGLIIVGGQHDGRRIERNPSVSCPTACLFLDPDTLVVANGSSKHRTSEWKRDLMTLGRSGSILQFDLRSGKGVCLLDGLAFPYGLVRGRSRDVYISEAWRHRVVSLEADAPRNATAVLEELPGYPARLHKARGSGYWLTLFAARSQLFEFVLTERRYREHMIAEIHPDYWIAPDLSTGKSYLEPMQGGGLKQMGIMKPWAPPRSYGLLIRCDDDMLPLASFHSRADGTQHGVTSVCDTGDKVLLTAKGRGNVLDLSAIVESGRLFDGATS